MTPEILLWLGSIVVASGTLAWALSKSFRIEKISLFDNDIILEKPLRWPGHARFSPIGLIVMVLGLAICAVGGVQKISEHSVHIRENPVARDEKQQPNIDLPDERPAVSEETPQPSARKVVKTTEGPEFFSPTIDGRTIDGCIKSYLFPEFQGRQCVYDAQRVIVDEFCSTKGYSVGSDWKAENTNSFQHSYKLFVEREKGGKLSSRWIEDNTGGFIFLYIRCA